MTHRFLVLATSLVILQPPIASAQTATPAVAFGARHAMALGANGDVLTWGDNVMCQLGRAGGNSSATPGLALRNAVEIAAGADHGLALTADGKVYGWGSNPEGALGTGHTYDQCEGPALIASLADKTIVHIATGYGFSVAVSNTGDLYCSGDNSMGQCPVARGGRVETFTAIANPELAGKVVAVKAGSFHTLALTRDGALYAFGRGNDGQLGNGRTASAVTRVADLTDVVSFAAGTWHSAAVRGDGSVWMWGNNAKSQLCDGTTTNRAVPTRVSPPREGLKITEVAAGAHATLLRAANGELYGCGDNQFGALGADKPAVVPRPVLVAAGTRASALAVGGANGAFSTDGCAVQISGSTDRGVAAGNAPALPFAVRAGLSLCRPPSTQPLPSLLRAAPSGGASNCWTPRTDEDAAASPKFAPLRQAMLAAETLLKQNAAFMAAPVPVRMRTSLSAGPLPDAGARMHVKATPERKADGTRLWTTGCGVIPQLDRIGGAIVQVSVFFNLAARGPFVSESGVPPKPTGQVGGYPEYNGWVLITRDGRVPWVPQTLADRLDLEGARRREALASWNQSQANMKPMDPAAVQKTYEMLKKSDAAGAEKFLAQMKAQAAEIARQQQQVSPAMTAALEQQVKEYEQYRASFTPEQLRAPAVLADVSGEGKRRLDAEVAALRTPAPGESRQARAEKAGPLIAAALAKYDLTNLVPGTADRALWVKADAAFPDPKVPIGIQIIAISFSQDPDPKHVERRAWQQRVKETFDYAALAALLE